MRTRELGGHGCDAAWADDFHHSLRTLLTDDREGYYAEFGRVAQLAKAFHRPHVHDGNYSEFRLRRFGAPADDVPPRRFVVFSQDHDQVGNRAFGDRMPESARPLAAFCVLLSPFVPLLFMGEEYGETGPFQFFSDHIDKRIADATREGRRREFAAFAEFGEEVPDPQDPATFERSKLTRRARPGTGRPVRGAAVGAAAAAPGRPRRDRVRRSRPVAAGAPGRIRDPLQLRGAGPGRPVRWAAPRSCSPTTRRGSPMAGPSSPRCRGR